MLSHEHNTHDVPTRVQRARGHDVRRVTGQARAVFGFDARNHGIYSTHVTLVRYNATLVHNCACLLLIVILGASRRGQAIMRAPNGVLWAGACACVRVFVLGWGLWQLCAYNPFDSSGSDGRADGCALGI